jgi:mRNA interferase RelE/StbE
VSDDAPDWSIQLSPAAVRSLDRLPHKIAAAIAEFITATLPTDPYTMSKPLRFELEGWRVARRGNYRVTFRALEDDRVLYIGRIEHRAHAYRRS